MLIPKNNIFLVIGLLGPYFETRHYFRHQNNHDVIIKIVSIKIVNGMALSFIIHFNVHCSLPEGGEKPLLWAIWGRARSFGIFCNEKFPL